MLTTHYLKNANLTDIDEINFLALTLFLTNGDKKSTNLKSITFSPMGLIKSEEDSSESFYYILLTSKSSYCDIVFYDMRGNAIGVFGISCLKNFRKRLKNEFKDKNILKKATKIAYNFRGTLEEVLTKYSTKEGIEELINYTKNVLEKEGN